MKISKTFVIAGTLVAALAVNGCQNRDIGTISGGVVGGLLASNLGKGGGKILAVGLGSIAGAMLGGHLGSQLDGTQQKQVVHTANHSLEYNRDGQGSTWRDPNQPVAATMTPVRTYHSTRGEYCREFQQDIQIGGQIERGYGTACRRPDGSWEIIS